MNEKIANSVCRGGLVLLLGFLFAKLGGIIFRILCMRELPLGAYGEVAIFMVISNWILLFATLNVTIGLARFVSANPEKKKAYLSSVLFWTLLLSVSISFALVIAAPAVSSYLNVGTHVIYWAAACTPFAAVYNIGIFYLRGGYRMKESTKADAVVMLARIGVLATLLYAGMQQAPYIAFLASFIAIDVIFAVRNRGLPGRGTKLRDSAREFSPILVYSVPIFIGEILRQLAMGLDRMALSSFFSPAEAGIYDAATALCLGYMIIAASYANALLPAAAAKGREKERRTFLRKSLKATLVLFFGFTAVLLPLGGPLLSLINPAYTASAGLIAPVALAYAICGILTLISFYAVSIGLQRYTIYAGAVFAFLSAALNLYLVPQMSLMGAAYALTASSAVSLALIGALVWRKEKS